MGFDVVCGWWLRFLLVVYWLLCFWFEESWVCNFVVLLRCGWFGLRINSVGILLCCLFYLYWLLVLGSLCLAFGLLVLCLLSFLIDFQLGGCAWVFVGL